MLIEFTTKNFRSFKDEATLSMVAENLKSNPSETFAISKDIDLLPAAGIFGPNASGKSNLLKALFFFKLAIESTNYLNVPVVANPLFQPYMLDEKSKKKPSYFQIVIWDKDTNSEFRYGFEATKTKITSEWLTETSKVTKNVTSKVLFTREGEKIDVSKNMDKNPNDLIRKVHPNGLALTVFAQFANPYALRVYELIRDRLFISDATFDLPSLTQVAFNIIYDNAEYKERLLTLLKKLDITIADITLNRNRLDEMEIQKVLQLAPAGMVEDINRQKELFSTQVLTSHKIYGTDKVAPFDMADFESIGTQRLFGLGAIILQVLDRGGTLVIDEFGNSLHPFLSREIVKIFQNSKQNKNNAQIVFSSHDTFLLTSKGPNLRRDQIWFTEKDKEEVAHLHSLAEYKTKKDLKIAKNYLEGRFGAVPVTSLGG